MTGSEHSLAGPLAAKGAAYSGTATEIGSGSESVNGKSDLTTPNERSDQIDAAELPALPHMQNRDDPVYVGVPAHMSGSKRWSTREFEK